MAPPHELTLRERKKARTRKTISDTATALFARRGFDAVTIDEVAAAADVSKKTVFNYFACKEDLFFDEAEAAEERLAARVRGRAKGATVLDAVRDHALEALERMCAGPEPWIVTLSRLLDESASLRAREAEIYDRFARRLAALIREERGIGAGDACPLVAARALLGVQRSVLDSARERVLAGERGPALAAALRSEAERGYGLLERGLGRI